ncbi:hypothetical protein [Sphingobium lignivorans]|uniref:Uncharacterized protein n=1 Tax=Sphingobium lignivorans TaxID=2735886 RepID=A0ABR6NJE5_9SPHN|nr:hypothetical protein [Sphingobium lignivorans]MBB5987395.1 hypothetical protein [Sphingobium lignivorans]
MSWLPSITMSRWCSCESDDATFEGREVSLRWGRMLFVIACGRKDVIVPPHKAGASDQADKGIAGGAKKHFRYQQSKGDGDYAR